QPIDQSLIRKPYLEVAHFSVEKPAQFRVETNNLHPDERIYTFWDYFRNAFARDAGLRIDHFLLSSEAATRLTKAEVDKHVRGWDHSSDHAPVWIELQDEPVKKNRKYEVSQED
ncbi:hypothetical protein EV131_12461, partial [Rhizobium laguerreae]